MTEDEWLGSADLRPMLKDLDGKATDRKLRLFGCGCCRRIWSTLSLGPVRRTVEAAERFSDGEITPAELDHAHRMAQGHWVARLNRNDARMTEPRFKRQMHRLGLGTDVAHDAPFQVKVFDLFEHDRFLRAVSLPLLRCVFGNPFRPVAFDPRWRTADTVGLARGIYEDRAFDRLPLLADALMDAGCADEQVIGHCRGDGPHVRGCWVVDLVLGKE